MKQIYIYILALCLCCGLGVSAQTNMEASDGYTNVTVLPEQTNFSAFDVQGNLLYGYGNDAISCYNLETEELVNTYPKPDDYFYPFISFVSVSPDGNTIWAGFTANSGANNDRIYSIDVTTGVWTLISNFSANYDIEFWNGQVFISGLNNVDWSGPNAIYMLDQTGSNNHLKIIEIGGSSCGLGVDSDGNFYYGTIGTSNDLYKWDHTQVSAVINDGAPFLTLSDAVKLADLPGGGSDCEVDEAGNVLFSCNGASGIIGVWNGTEGDGANYETIATTGYAGGIKSTGNVLESGDNNALYCGGYYVAITQITKEATTVVEVTNPIGTIVAPTAEITSIDISNVLVNATVQVENYNEDLFESVIIEGNNLSIQPALNHYDTSSVVVQYSLEGNLAYDTITVIPVTGMNAIENWVGTGANRAALVVQWDEGSVTDTLIWGYRWDGEATGKDMVMAIAAADPRLYVLGYQGTHGGFGYDVNLTDSIFLASEDYDDQAYVNTNGQVIIPSGDDDYDGWENVDEEDLWQSGWLSGFWAYYVRQGATEDWGFGSTGYGDRNLEDGDWDGWNYAPSYASESPSKIINIAPTDQQAPIVVNPIADINLPLEHSLADTIDITNVFTDPDNNDLYISKSVLSNSNPEFVSVEIVNNQIIINYLSTYIGEANIEIEAISNGQSVVDAFSIKVEDIDYTEGYFVVNEDWFGNDLGSVNFVRNNGEVIHRAFRRENQGEKLGTTTEFATIYGDKVYFVSKQSPRLVVADAHSLQKIASLDEFGTVDGNQSDGRAFVGIDNTTAYISTSNGIYSYSIIDNEVGEIIANTEGETGNMLLANGYVFAVQQSKIIILENNTVVSTIEGDIYAGLTRSMDGMVWVGASDKLIKINPYNLESETVSLPENAHIPALWGAWNANSLTASIHENAIYWGKAPIGYGSVNTIYKYTIGDTTTINQPFVTLPSDWVLYGASVRIHPINDEMYVVAKKDGWGENSLKNQVFIFDTETGDLQDSVAFMDYYWFPAMPMFADVHAPAHTLPAEINTKVNDADEMIPLMEYVSDSDNLNHNIVVSITGTEASVLTASVTNDTLRIHSINAGTSYVQLSINSNGKMLFHTINVNVSESEDLAPVVVNPIADVNVNENNEDYHIDLSQVFTDEDNDDTAITKTIVANTNESLVTTSISENDLTLSFAPNSSGVAEITVEALSNGKTVSDTFIVTVSPSDAVVSISNQKCLIYPNPSQGVFRIKLGEEAQIRIFNIVGQLVYQNEHYNSESIINISEQPAGEYIISVETINGKQQEFLIKQ